MASDPTMKIRGGGNPIANHGINAGQKNGPTTLELNPRCV